MSDDSNIQVKNGICVDQNGNRCRYVGVLEYCFNCFICMQEKYIIRFNPIDKN